MKDNIDFKTIWNQQPVETPSSKELLAKASKFKRVHLYKLVLTNIILLITSIFIVGIWYYYQPQFTSSKIGIILTILAMAIFLIVYNTAIPLLVKSNVEKTNMEYLRDLIQLKEKQRFLQSVMMNIYFLLLTTGLCLYLYEYTSRMEIIWAFVTYGITLAWIGFNWFALRPKIIKKQRHKINNLIDKFNRIKEQLNQ